MKATIARTAIFVDIDGREFIVAEEPGKPLALFERLNDGNTFGGEGFTHYLPITIDENDPACRVAVTTARTYAPHGLRVPNPVTPPSSFPSDAPRGADRGAHLSPAREAGLLTLKCAIVGAAVGVLLAALLYIAR